MDLHSSLLSIIIIKQEVDQAAASSYAEEIGAMYVETSAKDDVNVQDIFTKLSKNYDGDELDDQFMIMVMMRICFENSPDDSDDDEHDDKL